MCKGTDYIEKQGGSTERDEGREIEREKVLTVS